MKNSRFVSVMLGITILCAAGCATVMSGTTQRVTIKAVDQKNHAVVDAHCVITDGDGREYPVASNPGTAVLTKGKGALSVRCEKKGWEQSVVGSGQSFNAWTLANVVFWPGAIVDAATGAIQKYPSQLTVVMRPKTHKHA